MLFQNFAFPTASGITESMASTACQSALVDSSLGQICETVVDTTSLVTACITDVMVCFSHLQLGLLKIESTYDKTFGLLSWSSAFIKNEEG